MTARDPSIAIVAIGRNEGERLKRCLTSILATGYPVVYVDSGSTDGSIAYARANGVEVMELDMNRPFTAARGRNAGYERARALQPNLDFVFFIDGDCFLAKGFLEHALQYFAAHSEAAVVCGRRREIAPDASFYNRLADMEWDTPIGEAKACGGDAIYRCKAFDAVGGFNAAIIAGEEPELCFRLRQAGWSIHRIDADMAWHDADIHRFGQWWTRAMRSGHAYAEAMGRYGNAPERFGVRPSLSIWFWTGLWPLALMLLAWPTGGWSLAGLLAYPALIAKTVWSVRRSRRWPWSDSVLYGVACFIAKFPQMQGQIRYWLNTRRHGTTRIIEYKREPIDSSRPFELAVVSGGYPQRSETFVSREVIALRKRGFAVTTVGLHAPEQRDQQVASADYVVYGSEVGRTLVAVFTEFALQPARTLGTLAQGAVDAIMPGEAISFNDRLKLPVQALAGVGLAGRIRQLGIRHIHCHFAHAPTTVGMYAAWQLEVSFSFTGHANDLFQRRSLIRKKLQRASTISAISHWHSEFYRDLEPSVSGKVRVIRCGVDTGIWRKNDSTQEPGPLQLITVARLVEKKGIDTLLDALRLVREAGVDAVLTIVGDGPLGTELRQQALSSQVQEYVDWRGSLPNQEVREALGRADVFVLPCRTDAAGDRDGIPVVAMEAMACGLAVVIGDLPAIRELVIHEETGLLVAGNDANRLAEELMRLSRDSQFCERLGRQGRALVRAEFDLQINADRLVEAIRSTVKS